ncbi:unnamed protein product [Hyaloperonospora brassicae]|uniref:HTH OST-type domain-containing protein n=1 Tax=Hyaloperonospora brassicae TaxID=162125 RepID=A0AAV0TL92_HYABA|nr:unnamed protein product [Hyaloperonospora brassicae]
MPQPHLPLLANTSLLHHHPTTTTILPPLSHPRKPHHQPFPQSPYSPTQYVYPTRQPSPHHLLPRSVSSPPVDLTLSGPLRRGKWTRAEEDYAAATISYFCDGLLAIQYGTTLRGYLAQQLHCDPMRISKKLLPGSVFAGIKINPKIGRRAYYPCAQDSTTAARSKEQATLHLTGLRRAFIQSIEDEEALEAASTVLVKDSAVYCAKTAAALPPTPTHKAVAPLARKRSYDDINSVVRAQKQQQLQQQQQQVQHPGHAAASVKLTEPQIVYHVQPPAESAFFSSQHYAPASAEGTPTPLGMSKLPKLTITDDVSRRTCYWTPQQRSGSPVTVATSTLVLPPLRVSLVRASMC